MRRERFSDGEGGTRCRRMRMRMANEWRWTANEYKYGRCRFQRRQSSQTLLPFELLLVNTGHPLEWLPLVTQRIPYGVANIYFFFFFGNSRRPDPPTWKMVSHLERIFPLANPPRKGIPLFPHLKNVSTWKRYSQRPLLQPPGEVLQIYLILLSRLNKVSTWKRSPYSQPPRLSPTCKRYFFHSVVFSSPSSFPLIFPLWPWTIIHLKKVFPVPELETHLNKKVFSFLDLWVYRRTNVPLPEGLVPILVQVATLVEVPWSTLQNFKTKLFFRPSTSKFLFGIFLIFYLSPCLVVLTYTDKSLRLFICMIFSLLLNPLTIKALRLSNSLIVCVCNYSLGYLKYPSISGAYRAKTR